MSPSRQWFQERAHEDRGVESAAGSGPLVVVVGPCAAGKTTLAAGLRRLGVRAMVSGQEHSDIPTLWRHAEPDIVVALDVDLDTIRRRRGETTWPGWLYARQRARLLEAERAAAIRIDTTTQDADAVLAAVAQFLHDAPPGETAE